MSRFLPSSVAVLLLLLAAVPAAAAPRQTLFSVGLLGGFGGSVDEDDAGLSNTSLGLRFSAETGLRTHIVVRYSMLDFGGGERVGPLLDPELGYLTVAGEYRFPEGYFESGVFLGLGLYEMDGRTLFGTGRSDSAPGLTIGVTGDFPVTNRVGILLELAGHYADLDAAQLFATGHAGVTFHF